MKENNFNYWKETAKMFDRQLDKNMHNYKALCWKGKSLLKMYEHNGDVNLLKEAESFEDLAMKENILYPFSWIVMSEIYMAKGMKEVSEKFRECAVTILEIKEPKSDKLVKIEEFFKQSKVLWEHPLNSYIKSLPPSSTYEVTA